MSESKPRRTREIIVAIIGLSGVLVVGILSNLDKILPGRGKVEATYSGYQPTGDFETELRYFFDVSGTRKSTQLMSDNLFKNVRAQLIAQDPKNAERIDKIMDMAKKDAIKFDDIFDVILPVHKKYFTTSGIQELNKFYSTRPMRDMIEKMPEVQEEFGPILTRIMLEKAHPVVPG
jgi:hypothetical protein